MEETAVVVFENENTGLSVDIEVPLHISANDLIMALNDVYTLDIEPDDIDITDTVTVVLALED